MWLSLLKIKKSPVYVSGLTARNDKHDRKGKEVNVVLKNVMIKLLVSLVMEI